LGWLRNAGLPDVTRPRSIDLDARQLSPNTVSSYLLARKLVDSRALVDNDLIVRDFSSARNRVFSAESSNGASYLLKQYPHAEANLTAREAEVYQHLSSVPAMRKFMPRCYGYDAHLQILVLEFVSNAEDLASYHRGLSRPPIRVATAIGAILAELHCVSTRHCRSRSAEARPSALTMHRPHIRVARDCSPACLELVRILQNTEGYGSRLDQLNKTWAATTLIHRDVRHKNFLLTAPCAQCGMRI
jgi:Ser/Thr protein kinase RdoA (MazF antagonist)